MAVNCRQCKKRINCKTICKDVYRLLKNKKNNNGFYADTTHIYNNKLVDPNIFENILYTHDLSDSEKEKTKRIIIAILTTKQLKTLELIANGYSQKEVAKKLKISQSRVSQIMHSVKREIKNQFTDIIKVIAE